MPKSKTDYSEGVLSETGKWNTSKQYSELMIMKLLYECNEYQKIAYHGSSEIIDDLVATQDQKVTARLYGIERYITTLRMLISNSLGQVKVPNQDKLNHLKLKLNLLLSFTPSLKIQKNNQSMNGNFNWVEINEVAFTYALNEIVKINEIVSQVLTEEDLVYYNVEEFDEDRAKEEFTKKFIEEG